MAKGISSTLALGFRLTVFMFYLRLCASSVPCICSSASALTSVSDKMQLTGVEKIEWLRSLDHSP